MTRSTGCQPAIRNPLHPAGHFALGCGEEPFNVEVGQAICQGARQPRCGMWLSRQFWARISVIGSLVGLIRDVPIGGYTLLTALFCGQELKREEVLMRMQAEWVTL